VDPLFRWAGSKKKLLPEIRARFPQTIRTYHEPFCGSACLFFDILPQSAVLSDLNQDLMLTYREIQANPEEVHKNLASLEVSKENYYAIRALAPESLSSAWRAARFIYLNKLCFNGVYRTNKSGRFNVPMGSKTGRMPEKVDLQRYSLALRKVKLIEGDFESTLCKIKAGDLVYLDPPYSKPESRERGEYGLGSFHFSDIERLMMTLEKIDSAGASFILSYSDCEVIRNELRPHWRTEKVSVRRHVAGFNAHRKIVDELIVSNYL
jgi:DNA adenine methylase